MELIEAMQRKAGTDPQLRDLVRKFYQNHCEPEADRVSVQAAYTLVTGHIVWGIEFDTTQSNVEVLTCGAERLLGHHRTFVVVVGEIHSVLNSRNVVAVDVICADESS